MHFIYCYTMIAFDALGGGTKLIPPTAPTQQAPETFQVQFDTDVKCGGAACDAIVLNITRAWAPLGVDQFYALNKANYYGKNAFFRVVPGFVVQFGISGDPATNQKWKTPIKDDPITKSNIEGTITYATAGPNTRTTQLFINYADNSRLDKDGFAPFGVVVSGMDTAKKIFNPTPGQSGGVDQDDYTKDGNTWIKQKYPSINFITKAFIIPRSVLVDEKYRS